MESGRSRFREQVSRNTGRNSTLHTQHSTLNFPLAHQLLYKNRGKVEDMIKDLLADRTSTVLAKSLDGLAERHRAIASNIANVETPGYKRVEVSFEAELRQALQERGEAQAKSAAKRVQPRLSQDYLSPARADGNNVSIDQEATALIKNGLSYQVTTSLLNQKISALRQAITEGRR